MFSLDAADLIRPLQIQPELFGCPKEARQPDGRIGADAAPFQNNVIDTRRGNAESLCQFIRGEPHGPEKFLAQDFAGVNSPVRGAFSDYSPESSPSVIIGDFHFENVVVSPNKTDSILIVDADAVLALSVPAELF